MITYNAVIFNCQKTCLNTKHLLQLKSKFVHQIKYCAIYLILSIAFLYVEMEKYVLLLTI